MKYIARFVEKKHIMKVITSHVYGTLYYMLLQCG